MRLPFWASRNRSQTANVASTARTRNTSWLAVVTLLALLAAAWIPGVEAQSSSSDTSESSESSGSDHVLKTSSVAYCSTPDVLVVDTASLTLYPNNQTVFFELAAASLANDVNATVAIHVDAYGLGVIDFNLDLCSVAGGALCPLPTYQFNGGGVYPIPSQYLESIPTIAYTIPDLEAVATLSLTDSGGSVVACIQATLTNGNTAQQSGALWASVGVALLALFSSLLHSSIAQSVGAAQWRVVDVMLMIQHIAITGLLSMNFPEVFVSYALNFAWSIGLVDIPSLQNSVTSARSATGGHSGAVFGETLIAQSARNDVNLAASNPSSSKSSGGTFSFIANLAMSATGLGGVQQKGAEYSSGLTPLAQEPFQASSGHFSAATRQSPRKLARRGSIFDEAEREVRMLVRRAAQYAPNTGPNGQPVTTSQSSNIPIVQNNTNNYGGYDLYSQRANIAPDNVFLTVLVSIFILIAIVAGALLLTYAIVWITRALTRKSRRGRVAHWSRRLARPSEFGIVVAATAGRVFLIIMPPFFVFALLQWRFGDSWMPHFVAGIFMALFLLAAVVFFLPLFRHARRDSTESLYYGKKEPPLYGSLAAKRWGHMAHPYRPKFFWFALAFLVMSFIRACFVAFAQGRDFTQAVGLLVFEFVFFVLLCVFRVGRDKKSDWVFILLTAFRVATWAVCVAFTRRADVNTIPRAIVGFVLIVITGIPIIWLFFLTVWDLFSALLRRKRRPNPHYDSDAVAEKNKEMEQDGNHSSYGYGQVGTAGAAGAGAAGVGAGAALAASSSPGTTGERNNGGGMSTDSSASGVSHPMEQSQPTTFASAGNADALNTNGAGDTTNASNGLNQPAHGDARSGPTSAELDQEGWDAAAYSGALPDTRT
ncbi:unnamed protein product [Jaminaea pallidilutea]